MLRQLRPAARSARGFCSEAEPAQKWIPHILKRSTRYTLRPTEAQARSEWIKLTPYETQTQFNRRVYRDEVSALRKQYMEEYHAKKIKDREEVLALSEKKIKAFERMQAEKERRLLRDAFLDSSMVDDHSQYQRTPAKKAQIAARRQRKHADRIQRENLQQRMLLFEREAHWHEDPSTVTKDVFDDANVTSLKGFWPLTPPEQPSGFAGARVNTHIHFSQVPKLKLEEGETAVAVELYKRQTLIKRGEPQKPYFNPVVPDLDARRARDAAPFVPKEEIDNDF